MIAPLVVKQIETLLAQGELSQRGIAKLTGISRAAISLIAKGKRPDYAQRYADRAGANEPRGPLGRCPNCGGRVYLPCRLCRIRQLAKEIREKRKLTIGDSSPLAQNRPLPQAEPLQTEIRKVS